MARSGEARDGPEPGCGPSSVTIGNFDGVHRGHCKILRTAAALAREHGLTSVALTFDPHPLAVVAPARAPKNLTSIGQRSALIREQGIDKVAVMHFTADVARLSPRGFVKRILIGDLRARQVTVGAGFRFGRGQSGTTDTLRALGAEFGFAVSSVGIVLAGGEPVSSTRVRESVGCGDLRLARRLLGRMFCLNGPVVQGDGVGSKQTVPTLNIAPESEILPADGVYVTLARLAGEARWRQAVTNIGMRPTFAGRNRTVETHVLDKLEAAAPNALELGFVRKIRDERPFPSAESLRDQIGMDIKAAERFFRKLRSLPGRSSATS